MMNARFCVDRVVSISYKFGTQVGGRSSTPISIPMVIMMKQMSGGASSCSRIGVTIIVVGVMKGIGIVIMMMVSTKGANVVWSSQSVTDHVVLQMFPVDL